jgi:two-component system sensor histidine kinase/response regulator
MNILIIEDEVEIRQTLQDLLELNDYTVTAAADGREGLALAQSCPDLIFCDIGLPGLDGYEVLTAVRQLPQCRDIPFIFLTARVDRNDQRRSMALGADDFISKPFTEKDIIDAIHSRVDRLQPMRKEIEQLVGEHRSEITANWAHELLTPLNAVLGGLDLIEQEGDDISRDYLKELLQIIREGANRQHDLSKKLVLYFELQRIKEAPPSNNRSKCSVSKAIEAGVDRAVKAENRSQDITMQCASGEVPLYSEHLTEAIAEVVGNAFRFSKPGQHVKLTGVQNADRYIVEIVDEGIGMTSEQMTNIGSFMQFDRDKMEQQGLGLGLAIAHFVAEIGGGKFSLHPGPGGVGLLVRFDLPLEDLK